MGFELLVYTLHVLGFGFYLTLYKRQNERERKKGERRKKKGIEKKTEDLFNSKRIVAGSWSFAPRGRDGIKAGSGRVGLVPTDPTPSRYHTTSPLPE